MVGFAAAVYPTLRAGDEATIEETQAFLAAYEAARGAPFTSDEREASWAAGLWLRAFDATKQYALGQPVRSLTAADARARLRRAGAT